MSELATELRHYASYERHAAEQDTDVSRMFDLAADRLLSMEQQVRAYHELAAALRKVEWYRNNAPPFPWVDGVVGEAE